MFEDASKSMTGGGGGGGVKMPQNSMTSFVDDPCYFHMFLCIKRGCEYIKLMMCLI